VTAKSCLIALFLTVATTTTPRAAPPVSNPTVTGPISGGTRGQPFGALTPASMSASGDSEAEFFAAGTAASYEKDGECRSIRHTTRS